MVLLLAAVGHAEENRQRPKNSGLSLRQLPCAYTGAENPMDTGGSAPASWRTAYHRAGTSGSSAAAGAHRHVAILSPANGIEHDAFLDLLLSLCTALAIGLLIGAERGWQERDHEDARQIAGIRTFSLAGLLGGFATLLAGELGSAVWVALLLALVALAVAGYVSDVGRGGDQGMTTEIALLMTFLLGSLALTEQRLLAAAGGIVLTLLLSLRTSSTPC